ncbi:MAG: hypothetical protein IT479_09600 [Xanthomonadales bacterium]|nr:hypothetical protein [Xanthomonadales bacterium]MCE7932357.1 hypothetical protein [Xanthomonadales bacterium PRO6]
MAEILLVYAIVAAAIVGSVWQLMPASLRRRGVAAIARRCAGTRLARASPALARAAARPTGACAGCSARAQCPVGRRQR